RPPGPDRRRAGGGSGGSPARRGRQARRHRCGDDPVALVPARRAPRHRLALREGTLAATDEHPRRLLEEVARELEKPGGGLDFAGSYSVTRQPEPVYRGHYTGVAPPP